MRRGGIVVLVLLVAGLSGGPARADTRNIEVRNFAFAPATQAAQVNDTITWTWTSGFHSVTSWDGPQSFDSGTRGAPNSFSITFGGGTVRYYCIIHSTVDASGCHGTMCGVLTEDSTPPAPPAITEPASGATTGGSVRIAGTASADTTTVRLREGPAILQDLTPTGGTWSTVRSFTLGSHTVTATALDAIGNESSGTSVTFNVSDLTPPTVEITSPAQNGLAISPVTISGEAHDNIAVTAVSVRIVDLLGAVTDVQATCSCGPDATWSVTVDRLPGIDRATAFAVDGVGNAGQSAERQFIVL